MHKLKLFEGFKLEKERAGSAVFTPNAYCYDDKCPARTKASIWPKSDSIIKYIPVMSKKGNKYYKKAVVCRHCGKEMTFTCPMNHDDY